MDQIVDRLKFVADSQSLDYDEAALEFAKASEGGMRDALVSWTKRLPLERKS